MVDLHPDVPAARPRRLFARLRGPGWLRVLVAVALVRGALGLLLLPLDAAQHEHGRRNGLTDQAWPGFLRDEVVSWLIGVVVSALLACLVVGCARRWRSWPVSVAAVAGGLVLLGSYGYPLVVEPLFNSFHSLPAGPLRTEVMQLADREGVHVDDVLVGTRDTFTPTAAHPGRRLTIAVRGTTADGLSQVTRSAPVTVAARPPTAAASSPSP